MNATPADRPQPGIVACRGVSPQHRYAQEELTEAVAEMIGCVGPQRELLRRIHANAGVRHRSTVLPIEQYATLDGFGPANDAFLAAAVELGTRAVAGVLANAGLAPRDVDLLLGPQSPVWPCRPSMRGSPPSWGCGPI